MSARRTIDTQATQILSLEAALQARPPVLPETASEKDQLIAEQAKTIRELEIVVAGYEENLGEPLRQVREDVEREWITKLEEEQKIREEKEVWAREVERELEREKGVSLEEFFVIAVWVMWCSWVFVSYGKSSKKNDEP